MLKNHRRVLISNMRLPHNYYIEIELGVKEGNPYKLYYIYTSNII